MLNPMEVREETINGLLIGTMIFDLEIGDLDVNGHYFALFCGIE